MNYRLHPGTAWRPTLAGALVACDRRLHRLEPAPFADLLIQLDAAGTAGLSLTSLTHALSAGGDDPELEAWLLAALDQLLDAGIVERTQ